MRFINSDFSQYHYSPSKEPQQVVEIQFGANDLAYFTSHADTPVPASSQIFYRSIAKISGTTQTITPDEGRSTIGNISVDILDKNGVVTALFKNKDDAGEGARYSRVRVYQGYKGMTWAQFSGGLVQTQIIDDITYGDGFYTLQCADIQRSLRQDIFDTATTTMSGSVSAVQTLIPVYSVANFQTVMHGTTYTDAPSARVGYLKIEDEIIRWTGTTVDGLLGLCFIVDTNGRGALGTKAVEHQIDQSAAADQRTAVDEFIYLELPALKLIYALLTGSLYGQIGEHLPDSWHLAIGGEWVRTADFIGAAMLDLWNAANDDGFIVRFAGLKKQDGKKFIETELCLLTGTYMPVYSNGEIGLKRFTSILHSAPHIFELNRDNVKSTDRLGIDQKSVFNLLSIEWNYDFIKDALTRQKILVDTISQTKYKNTPAKTLQFNGLHGSRHTATTVEGLFDRLRDRYAAPPQRLSVKCQPVCNVLEVGDIVLVDLPHLRDYFTGGALSRSFEVQQVSVDWTSGDVTVQLFGSSQPAGPIRPDDPGEAGVSPGLGVISAALWTSIASVATNLATYSAGGFTSGMVGSVRQITAAGSVGLPGNDNAYNHAAWYFHNGDLQLNSGITLNFSKNIVLFIDGHLQINGAFNGKGRGRIGATAYNLTGVPLDASGLYLFNQGSPGYIGPTISGGAVNSTIQYGKDRWDFYSYDGAKTEGSVHSVPAIQLTLDAASLIGWPQDAQGTSGPSGGNVWYWDTHGTIGYQNGGAGGNSGAGIIIIARGVSFGASGSIDTSGDDGSLGTPTFGHAYSGSGGGGACGAQIFIIDGIDNEIPELSHCIAKYGATPIPSTPVGFSGGPYPIHVLTSPHEANDGDVKSSWNYSYYTNYGNTPPDLSAFGGGARILFVPPIKTAATDVPQLSDAPAAILLNEIQNTPPTSTGNQSTVEVTVTPPTDTTYAYSNIYYRVYGAGQAWKYAGPADPELDIVFLADGTDYEFLALPVSKITKKESPVGTTAQLTLSTINSQLPADISGVQYTYVGGLANINWPDVVDKRKVDYEVRAGATWNDGILIRRVVSPNITVPTNATYWIAARIIGIDGVNVYSAIPAEVIIAASSLQNNIIATFSESSSWLTANCSGGAEIVGGILELTSTGDILSATDVLSITDVLNYGSISGLGYFTSPNTVDAGRVENCTVTVDYAATATVIGSTSIPDAAQLIRLTPQINIGDASAVYAGWQDYYPGQYTGRYFQIRLKLESFNPSVKPEITPFAWSVDVEDLIQRGASTGSSSADTAVSYAKKFISGNNSGLPVLGFVIYGAATGDYVDVTAQSLSGFSYSVRNSSGARVAKAIGWTSGGW